jgi:hypothetical protein
MEQNYPAARFCSDHCCVLYGFEGVIGKVSGDNDGFGGGHVVLFSSKLRGYHGRFNELNQLYE